MEKQDEKSKAVIDPNPTSRKFTWGNVLLVSASVLTAGILITATANTLGKGSDQRQERNGNIPSPFDEVSIEDQMSDCSFH